ncbi:MAG TPA: alanine--tRNA ligase [Pyrinomonadaceae bacterium]|nr:alanine--tRNA ligase [Pyrinomonadaceae bacterium]
MNGNEIRRRFLEYFERNGHKIVHSSPLLPANDPTLLFTNAGMNQFKDVFTGQDKRDYTRATSSQKCIRAGGKHNDLDEVGKTARHHTFFEMLGNFSFGDYFKEDAIRFAWDFLVNELKLEENRLWFSVFEGDAEVPADDEARALWEKAGAKPERILGFGRKDNFWQMGDTGPCGPCSEIHYYMGDQPDNPEKNHPKWVNGEGDTTMEIWNLVFMQFERSEDGNGGFKLTPLPAPSVDTGAGLERMAAVLQGVSTNYDTDLLRPIIDFTAGLTDRFYEYDTQEGFAMRVVADHARSTTFAIADGILPGNEGRNYVLRKIMRRAIYHGREHLGFNGPFFHKVCGFVVELMQEAYPELTVQKDFIDKMVRLEEERFGNTMTVGLKKLNEMFAEPKEPDFSELAKLYDTFGTPKDLIRVFLESHGIEFTEEEFSEKFDGSIAELQANSEIGKTKQAEKINPIYAELQNNSIKSNFQGYELNSIEEAKVVGLVKNDVQVNELNEGDEGLIILDETPFYAESGGQVGDSGTVFNANSNVKVFDTFAPITGIVLHKSKIEKGSIKIGDSVTATIDVEKRDATRRNHTATHLVHAALREVLGTHVKQGGSVVAPNYLRFDFTHYQPLSESEIKEVEDLVNREILLNHTVNTDLMSIEDAMRTGAMALFGEKYGEKVRVLSVGNGEFSRELCGGTHVRATGDIGSFKITADEAIASGVRRIRAITGFDSFARFREDEKLISDSLNVLKTQRDNLPNAIEKLQEELKKTRKEIDDLKMKIATGAIGGASSNGDEAKVINGVNVVAKTVDGLDKGGMRHLSDTLMAKMKSGVVILARTEDEKVSFIVRVSDDLTKKVSAGNIVREIAPIVGGRGGGKPDMAEGGGTDAGKLSEAIEASYKVIENMLQ